MTIRARAALAAKQTLVEYAYEPGPLGPRDVEIDITHCGVCHSDLNLIDNDWSTSTYPLVPGHEIVGVIRQAGSASSYRSGQRVGMGWQRSACFECELCQAGHENLCLRQEATCVGHMGGFAERIRADERFVFEIPAELGRPQPRPCFAAGSRSSRPCCDGKFEPALRSASLVSAASVTSRSASHERWVVERSRSPHRPTSAPRPWAWAPTRLSPRTHRGRSSRRPIAWTSFCARRRQSSTGSPTCQALKPNGVLCFVGVPPGLLQIPASQLLTGQRVLCGSDIGSPSTIREMLAFAAAHRIRAEVETAPLADVNAALARVRENRVRYRMVLTT